MKNTLKPEMCPPEMKIGDGRGPDRVSKRFQIGCAGSPSSAVRRAVVVAKVDDRDVELRQCSGCGCALRAREVWKSVDLPHNVAWTNSERTSETEAGVE